MKKFYLFAAVVIVIALAASSAYMKNKDKVKEAETGPPEITVVTMFDGNDGNNANFVSACKAYEAATGNKVIDRSSTMDEAMKAKINEDFRNGNEPDVLFYFIGADADELIQNGKLVPISDIRKEYQDYAPNMKDSMIPVAKNGRQYAVPINGYWEGMFVNKKVLDACGVPAPGADYTWERFLADCRTIKDAGYIPVSCSLLQVPHYLFEFTVFNNGSLASHINLPASSGDDTGKIWAAGLLDIKELYDLGFLPGDILTLPYEESTMLMLTDEAAFMIDGSWKVGWFKENAADIENFIVTYVPGKGSRKATEIIGGISMGYYITKKAWDDPVKRKACVDFVMAMTTDEVVSAFSVNSLSVTALKNGIKLSGEMDSLVASVLEMTKGCTGIVPAVQDLLNQNARNALFENVPDIATGKITPEEAIDNCLAINNTKQ